MTSVADHPPGAPTAFRSHVRLIGVALGVVVALVSIVAVAKSNDEAKAPISAGDGKTVYEGSVGSYDWRLEARTDGDQRCLEITFDGGRSGNCTPAAEMSWASGAPVDASGTGDPVFVYGFAPPNTEHVELLFAQGSGSGEVVLRAAPFDGAVLFVAVHDWDARVDVAVAYDGSRAELARAQHRAGDSH